MKTSAPLLQHSIESLLHDPDRSCYADYLSGGLMAGFEQSSAQVSRGSSETLVRWRPAGAAGSSIDILVVSRDLALFVFSNVRIVPETIRVRNERFVMLDWVVSGSWRQTARWYRRPCQLAPLQCMITPASSSGPLARSYVRSHEPLCIVSLVCTPQALRTVLASSGAPPECTEVFGRAACGGTSPVSLSMPGELICTIVDVVRADDPPQQRRSRLRNQLDELLRKGLRRADARAGTPIHPPLRLREMERLSSVHTLLHRRIESPPTLRELTAATGIHANRLSAGFREMFGCTIYQYALDVRMRKALELLRSGRYSVSQVSDFIGYEEVPSFSRMFKLRYGKAPSDISKVSGMTGVAHGAGVAPLGGTALALGEP